MWKGDGKIDINKNLYQLEGKPIQAPVFDWKFLNFFSLYQELI